MRLLRLIIFLACVLGAIAAKNETSKSRDKRQHLSHLRGVGRPPPYAVQMEPIAQYSQRDPLYNPLTADAKNDVQPGYYDESLYNYYPTEPEPIIEIIIKESNESLPTPVPPPPPPKSKKEPIQVFYVKYEKKQEYGEDKPRVVYDAPIPAITPVEEHEEIKPDEDSEGYPPLNSLPVTPAPPEPSTTLRAIIRPDSETFHVDGSGIRVTFGSEAVPPNNHNKRSDPKDLPADLLAVKPTGLPPPGSSKRPHGPFAPLQPIPPRVTPAFPQQRIVNSFSQQQLLGPPVSSQPGPPPNFALQPQFHQSVPPHIRNPYQQIQQIQRPQQRPAISIQGLPEVQQRLPFNQFGPPHRLNVNHPQQPGAPPTLSVSHQNVQLQNFPQQQQQLPNQQAPTNFNYDPTLQYKQQQQQREQEKQRYFEQQRLQEQKRQQEIQRLQNQQRQQEQKRQQELQRQQEQQRQQELQRQQEQQRQEQYRLLEQQRRKQEQEQKLRLQQQQQQQQSLFHQQQYKFGQQQPQQQQPQQQPLQHQQPQQQLNPGGEILKAIPKLEQHYAIRENPLFPGPFPPNPVYTDIPQQNSFGSANSNKFSGSLQQPQQVPQQSLKVNDLQLKQQYQQQQQQQQQTQQQLQQLQQLQQHQQQQLQQLQQQSQRHQQQQQQQQQQQSIYQDPQSFFAQNLPTPQQQRPQAQDTPLVQSSIWGRPVYQGKNLDSNQKIYATPVTKTASNDYKKSSASTPNSLRYTPTTPGVIRYSSTTPRPATTSTTTQPSTTPLTTTTLSPRNEAKIKENIANLPDEVPDDIREQLLSSGILGNADIQILDYDKVGGYNIGDLPPEALANFYGAGGAAATAASEPVPQLAKRPKAVIESGEVQVAASTTNLGKNSVEEGSVRTEEVTLRPGGVEMKVVRFDPNTAQGQSLAERHLAENATQLGAVALGDQQQQQPPPGGQYNRYLPLKVSGASFPIPDAPELRGKRISSVVVLAPVDYGFQPEAALEQSARQNRKIAGDVQAIRFLAGESLKQLVKKPTAENYKRWLEQERLTEPQRQSVVLLVTTPSSDSDAEKEIFMYDVSSESVSKLAGDLSTAFVDAAESNSDADGDPMAEV